MLKIIKKADIILLILLVSIGLVASYFAAVGGTKGAKAVITVDGQLYGTYSLSKNQTIVIERNNHRNKITIKNGKVQMASSSCKNQVCVHEGAISKTNQSIVCLPNRVMVQIQGGDSEYDAIAN